jgi:hypothetical protein
MNRRVDNMDRRIERIEERLDLVEAGSPHRVKLAY